MHPLLLLPTTSIGSFPQTEELRPARAAHRKGTLDDAVIAAEIERTIRYQEQAGLDVLVHGEAERNDMVEYFANNWKATPSPVAGGCKATVRAV